jgi:hypothetical protein
VACKCCSIPTSAATSYQDATREWRTGVSRQGQGVDPNALQNQVATIANQMLAASQAKMKLVARIFAETGIRDLFCLLHATIRRHGGAAETVRLRNRWVSVDSRAWRAREDMTVNVGLGTGSKAEQLAQVQLLVGVQERAVAAGLVSRKNFYNSAKELIKLIGHKNVDMFFTAPDAAPDPRDPAAAPITPPPDPKMAEMQAKAEIEKLQAQADIETQRAKAAADIALAERKFELERELKILDAQIKAEEHRQAMVAAPAAQQPKASIEINTLPADEVRERIASLVAADTARQDQRIQALVDMVQASARRPKRLRGPSGRTYELQENPETGEAVVRAVQ